MSFNFTEDELPEVVEARSYTLGDKSLYAGEKITYFDVGDWSMSSLDVEDANIKLARRNALAWISWLNFLENNPEVIVNTSVENEE